MNQSIRKEIIVIALLVLCLLGALAFIVKQRKLITQLRGEIAKSALIAERMNGGPPAVSAAEVEQLRKDRTELLDLRAEVRQLRDQSEAQPTSLPQPSGSAQPGPAEQLALAAMHGDLAALNRLAEFSVAAYERSRTNSGVEVFADLRAAFDKLATEAGKGNEGAFTALWRATQLDVLEGFAVQALGVAAGLGNEKALQPLLNPEEHMILKSSAVAALQPAADNGNTNAINALAAVARDQNAKPLWHIATISLQKAALAGNTTAIDALALLARSSDQNVKQAAIRALEAAAFQQNPRAAQALREITGQ